MLKHPSISVITPVYNAEPYLLEYLNSLKDQSMRDFEVIAIDDGSEDDSLNVLQEYARGDKRFRILTQSHDGPSAARNYGIMESKGDFICFLDADDFLDIDALNKLYERAVKTRADFVAFNLKYYNNDSRETSGFVPLEECPKVPEVFSHKTYADYLFTFQAMGIIGFYRRKFLIQNNLMFGEELKRFEDFVFKVKVLVLADRISFVDEGLYNVRYNITSSTTTTFLFPDDRFTSVKEAVKFLRVEKVFDNVKRSLQFLVFRHLYEYLLEPQNTVNFKDNFTAAKNTISETGLQHVSPKLKELNLLDLFFNLSPVEFLSRELKYRNDNIIWLKNEVKNKDNDIRNKDSQIKEEKDKVAALDNQIEHIISSLSWKITKPLRYVNGAVQQVKRKKQK